MVNHNDSQHVQDFTVSDQVIPIQWNLGIRDTQGTVKNCPEFWGGLISQVHFYVLDRPRDWSSCP